MNFDEKADRIISTLGQIHHSTYISVIIFKNSIIEKIKSNNFNNWQNIMFNGGLYNDCLLFKSAEKFNRMAPNQEDIIVWDNVVDSSNEIHKMRIQHGLHHGISVIFNRDDQVAWCISACSDLSQNKEFFHTKFHSKKASIKDILRN